MFHLNIAILYHLVVVQLKNIVLCELNWYGIDLYWNNHVNVVILGLHTCLSIINFICTIVLYPICNLHAHTECTVKVSILLHHSDHFDMISYNMTRFMQPQTFRATCGSFHFVPIIWLDVTETYILYYVHIMIFIISL